MIEPLNKKLLFRCTPEEGESLYGFVARVAATNQLDNAKPLVQAAGLSYDYPRIVGTFMHDEAQALARVLTVDAKDLTRMYYSPGALEFRLDGVLISNSMFCGSRRVAPASLKEAAYHRRSWQIQQMPFCPETWEILISSCPECKVGLKWSPTPGILFCQRCGFDLRRAVTLSVEERDREPLAMLAGLMAPDHSKRAEWRSQLSTDVAHLQTGDLLQLAILMGAAMLPAGTRDLWANKPKRCRSLADGARRLLDPQGPFSIWLGHSNAVQPAPLLRTRRDVKLQGSQALGQFVDQQLGDQHGLRRLRDLRQSQQMLTLTDAARTLKLERGILRRVIDAAFPLKVPPRGEERKFQWIEPDELELLRQRLENSVSEVTFAREFGLNATAVEQLKLAGLVYENFDQAVQVAFEAQALTAESVARFRAKLRAHLAPKAQPDWVTVRASFLAIGARQKPWAALIRAIFDGSVPAAEAAGAVARLSIGALLVPGDWEASLPGDRVESQARAISRTEAEHHLNCNPRDLSQVGSAWKVDEGPDVGFLREKIEAFGREYISMREILARTRANYQRVLAILQQNGVLRAKGVFWRRAEVESLLQPRTSPPGPGEEFTSLAVHGFGAKVASLRQEAGLSVHTVNELTGWGRGRLAAIEKGRTAVELSTIATLAGALGTSRSELARTSPRARAFAQLVDRLDSASTQQGGGQSDTG